MKQRIVLIVAVAVLLFLPRVASAQSNLRCESNGYRTECSFVGPGVVSLSRQLSSNDCVEGRTWGVNGDRVWVDSGCRADFVVTPSSYSGSTVVTNGGSSIICESGRFSTHRCAADTRFGVQFNRQLSSRSCIQGKTWGFDNNGVWVSRGCRAEFILNGPAYSSSSANSQVVVCESHNNTKHWCTTDTRFGVSILRQLSSENSCILGNTWGYDKNGIWVDKGCRAEFSVGR